MNRQRSALVWNIFAGLAQIHPQDLEPMPDIARRWDISDDGKRCTFHLRESTGSDGTPLTARDSGRPAVGAWDPRRTGSI